MGKTRVAHGSMNGLDELVVSSNTRDEETWSRVARICAVA